MLLRHMYYYVERHYWKSQYVRTANISMYDSFGEG